MSTSPFEASELCHQVMSMRQEKSGLGFCLRLNMFSVNNFQKGQFGCKIMSQMAMMVSQMWSEKVFHLRFLNPQRKTLEKA